MELSSVRDDSKRVRDDTPLQPAAVHDGPLHAGPPSSPRRQVNYRPLKAPQPFEVCNKSDPPGDRVWQAQLSIRLRDAISNVIQGNPQINHSLKEINWIYEELIALKRVSDRHPDRDLAENYQTLLEEETARLEVLEERSGEASIEPDEHILVLSKSDAELFWKSSEVRNLLDTRENVFRPCAARPRLEGLEDQKGQAAAHSQTLPAQEPKEGYAPIAPPFPPGLDDARLPPEQPSPEEPNGCRCM